MIRTTISRLSKRPRGNTTKKHISKILYLARDGLPDKNPVKNILVYYWYLEGPYSEKIYANLDQMVSNGSVIANKTDKYETYNLVPKYELKPMTSPDNDIDEARREISSVTSKFPNTNSAIQAIYEHAPYGLYNTYKQTFMPRFKTHCRDVLTRHESMYANHDILDLLGDAVLNYPNDPTFTGHRMAFMDFAKMINTFLRWDSYHTHKDMLDILQVLCKDIWETFAYGVRIHHHDSYYDDRIDNWRTIYDTKLAELDHNILKHAGKFDVIDEPRLSTHIEDMVLHPEKYEFTPLQPNSIVP